jgi:carboxyl-terminal processing protease
MRKLFIVFIAISLGLGSTFIASREEVLLKPADVHFIMDQLLELHVDKKEVSPIVMERSFDVYVDNFDREKIYLLESDIAKFLNPTPKLLEWAVKDYQEEDYSLYEELHSKIVTSIYRAREMRRDFFAQDREGLFDYGDISYGKDKDFAHDEDELENNLRRHWAFFATLQEKRSGEITPEKRELIIKLYEKRARDFENRFLCVDDNGIKLPKEEQKDFIVLNVIKSLSRSLDAHTDFFSPTEAFDMKMRLEKGFCGLGVVLEETIDGVTITKLIDGGPAAESGLVVEGDHIISIDSQAVENRSFKNVLKMIRGEKGSYINLGIKRIDETGKAEYLSAQVQRDSVVLNEKRVDVTQESFGDGTIGVVKLYSFYEGENGISSEKDLALALDRLRLNSKLNGLILDLRENTGGFLQQAIKVSGLFIKSGVVVMSKYSTGAEHYYRDVDGYSYFDGPLIILTSKMSASAAEIVAQTLQDYGVALVVGDERTYGKGSIQHQTVTSGEAPSFFKVTVGRYYTVSGRSTQVAGVKADVIVPGIYNSMPFGEEFLEYPLVVTG